MQAQADMMQKKGFLTAAAAAEKVGNTVYTIYRWVEDGKIQGMKVGKHWYVNLESLVRFMDRDWVNGTVKPSTLLGLNTAP